jgi:hypothetical protein
MKKHVFVAFALFAIACNAPKHSTAPSGNQSSASGSSQEGTSYETAIVIKEKSETAGVAAEYKWIREHYPGSRNKGQGLQTVKGKSYDVLTIETAGGETKTIYFDISNFFGHLL